MSTRAASPKRDGDQYVSPLVSRNASAEMAALFSPRRRALAWREVWLALAESQHEMGLPITTRQLKAMRDALHDIDLKKAAAHERKTRHDLMAHLHTYADVAPEARPILHMGATSMDVVDNADLCIMRDALRLTRGWLYNVVDALANLAAQHRDLTCLGFTHYQPAQLTTFGKRVALWCWEFVGDLEEIDRLEQAIAFRGIRGATGTQASFLQLLGNSPAKVEQLEKRVADKLGFTQIEPVCGQTYTRKHDARVMAALAGIGASAHRMANDIRLLSNLREVAEPFGKDQVGSSAMPYKKNPMLCERATGLSRFLITLSQSAFQTSAEQWLERTLDDSSNKRIIVPEGFLAADGILQIMLTLARGLVVYPKVMAARVASELPFMATESVMMSVTAAGGDRQALHEKLKRHAHAAAERMYGDGEPNDLLERLKADAAFNGVDWAKVLDVKRHVGMAPRQVDQFIKRVIGPLRKKFAKLPKRDAELRV